MKRTTTKTTVVLVSSLVVCLVGVFVAQKWDNRYGKRYNTIRMVLPWTLPHISSVMHKPLADQIRFLTKARQITDVEPAEFAIRHVLLGDAYADAMFGPNGTRIAELKIPYNDDSSSSSGGGVPVTCACPKKQQQQTPSSLPLVLFFHSGGLISGSVNEQMTYARHISKHTRSVVCSIDYRLAPEHPYPAAINDALLASLALIGNAEKNNKENPITKALGVTIDPTKIATFGSSAGGYLAAHAARLLAYNGVSTKIQVCLNPMVKPNSGTDSLLRYFRTAIIWDGIWNTYAWSVYLRGVDEMVLNDWRINLLVDPPALTSSDNNIAIRRMEDLLPEAYIQIATQDTLRDEGEAYAMKLKSQGKLIGLNEYDTFHGGILPIMAYGGPADGAYETAVEVLNEHLHSK